MQKTIDDLSQKNSMTILTRIITQKKTEVDVLKQKFWKSQNERDSYLSQIKNSEISFYDALKKVSSALTHKKDKSEWSNLIAEVKKGSPSQGLIRADFDVAQIVKLYDKYAAAMSILTDEKFFLGSLENLKIARQNTKKPLLRKDFILDEFQIYEARLAGADAILLLASVLTTTQIQKFLDLTHALGMDALVEIHTEEELKNVLQTNAKIIGINNRNLKDFSIDLENSNKLAPLIPSDKIIVSESGINSRSDIRKIHRNADAILVGTAITKHQNMENKIREIAGIPQIKICGITNLEDAQAAVEMGTDYLGFIFYTKSPRNVEPERCAEIIRQLQTINRQRTTKFVGVFVNKKIEEIVKIVAGCGLDVVQLHGEENSVEIENLKLKIKNYRKNTSEKNNQQSLPITKNAITVWKALRIKTKKDLEQITEFKNADGILLDTFHAKNYGGTGETFDWEILTDFYPDQKIILAGGLDASNIQKAIKLFYPDVVDISSRIEAKSGKKNLGKMQDFFEEITPVKPH